MCGEREPCRFSSCFYLISALGYLLSKWTKSGDGKWVLFLDLPGIHSNSRKGSSKMLPKLRRKWTTGRKKSDFCNAWASSRFTSLAVNWEWIPEPLPLTVGTCTGTGKKRLRSDETPWFSFFQNISVPGGPLGHSDNISSAYSLPSSFTHVLLPFPHSMLWMQNISPETSSSCKW